MKRQSKKQGARKAPMPAEPKLEFVPYTRQLSKGEVEELMKVGHICRAEVSDAGLIKFMEKTENSLKVGWQAWIVGFHREFETVKFVWGNTRIRKTYTPTPTAPHLTESLQHAGISPLPTTSDDFDKGDRSCGFDVHMNSSVYPKRFIDEFESAEFDPLEKIIIPRITAENYSEYVYLCVWHGDVLAATFNGNDRVILNKYYYGTPCSYINHLEWLNGICVAAVGKESWQRFGNTIVVKQMGKKLYSRSNKITVDAATTMRYETGTDVSVSLASRVYHSPVVSSVGHIWPVFVSNGVGRHFYSHGVSVDSKEWISFNRIYMLKSALSLLPSTLSREIMEYI